MIVRQFIRRTERVIGKEYDPSIWNRPLRGPGTVETGNYTSIHLRHLPESDLVRRRVPGRLVWPYSASRVWYFLLDSLNK